MRKQKLFACCVLGQFLIASLAAGQELPSLRKVIVKSDVSFSDEVYSYAYTIVNDPMNVGDIYMIDIDITKPPSSLTLSAVGLTNGPNFSRQSTALVLEEVGGSIIPVGLSSPPYWSAGLSLYKTAGWGGSDKAPLLPGQSLSGFLMTSYGLPGIRDFKVDPFVDVDTLSDEVLPPDDIEAATKLKEKLAFLGKTIGPTGPPANFVALDFVSYIIDLKHQAVALGWITNKGVENSLDVKLDQVKKKLETGDTKTAANVLNAFLNEVDAQGCSKYEGCPAGKYLLPEAWALLKFNAEYLLGKL